MAQGSIPVPKALVMHDGNLAEGWKRFKAAFTNYELATEFNEKSDAKRVALLLSVIGEDAVEVYDTFAWTAADDKTKLKTVLEQFEKYCIPRKNVLYETYKFTCRKQQEGEPIDRYITNLKKIADNCEFSDKPRRMRDQLVFGIKDDKVRERLLRDADPKFEEVVEIIRANEIASAQSAEISEPAEFGHQIRKSMSSKSTPALRTSQQQESLIIHCKYCGEEHIRKKEVCPAYGKTCNKCKRMNHFGRCCLSARRNTLQVTNEATEESLQVTDNIEDLRSFDIFQLEASPTKKHTKTFMVHPFRKPVTFHIDTGASCNVMPFNDYVRITSDVCGKHLLNKKINLKTYGGKSYTTEGMYKLAIKSRQRSFFIEVHVVKLQGTPLLSLRSCVELGILKILDSDQEQASQVAQTTIGVTKEQLLNRFKDVFTGVGKLSGVYKIKLRDNANPVIHAPRKVPIPLRDPLKEELDRLEREGIISKVTTPTDWVSSLMIVRKPGKFRVYIDPFDLNQAIKREHYQLPCIEEVAPRMRKAKVFSVFDVRSGFHHVELDEESSYLTTFHTPFGRYRWNRLPFGVASAPEVFQRKMHEFAEGLEGAEVIADDFVLYGEGDTYEQAVRDHDERVCAMLNKARQENLRFNGDKIKYKLLEVPFMGHILSRDGVKPDPKKVESIVKMPEPTDEKGLRRILGMIQYLAKFLPSLSEKTTVLRKLLHKTSSASDSWEWSAEHSACLQTIKQLIVRAPILAYFNPAKAVTIQADASESGIGAVLLQEEKPVHFTSRAMTPTEQNYAQIEKEMLAIVHSCSRFDHYIYGHSKVHVETDHKPLEVIFKKPMAQAPKRLQRMMLFLQKYQLTVSYKRGAELYIADTLSRANLPYTENDDLQEVLSLEEAEVCADLYQISLTRHIPNSCRRMEEIRLESHQDKDIQTVLNYVRNGWPDCKTKMSSEAKPYFHFREQLTEEEGLLFKGQRIVIPSKLRYSVMQNIHASHMGSESCVRRAREYVYWPSMNANLLEYISSCDICNSRRNANQREPMQSHALPGQPWQIVSSDMFEMEGHTFILIVDHYSNFFEYQRLTPATSTEVIKFLKIQFARYGVPEKLMTDNGPQYQNQTFAAFSKTWGFDHVTSSPRYPQSNRKAEITVKICKQLMIKSIASKGDFQLALLDYRNTPDVITGLSPAQKCFSKRTRTTLPIRKELLSQEKLPNIQSKIKEAREHQKEHYDKHARTLPALRVGDTIRMQLPGQTDWSRGSVEQALPFNSYNVRVNAGIYRRNRRALIKTNDKPQAAGYYDDSFSTRSGAENAGQGAENADHPNQCEPLRRSTRQKTPRIIFDPSD